MKNQVGLLTMKGFALLLLVITGSPAGGEEIFFAVQDRQGKSFVGEVTQAGFESKIQAVKYQSEFINYRESATGQIAQGKGTIQGPITLTKKLGAASFSFFKAMTENEILTVTIDFVSPHRSGKKVPTHSLSLYNAKVVGIKQYSEPMGPNLGFLTVLEEMTFSFENFEMKNLIGGTSPPTNILPPFRR
ncbi:MAG: type VI secretion system tube protein Hcp [Nitrospirales bacterium]|nr:type VI secretion system tube protein Hcp [Nitrospirales bacterium]